MKRKGLYIPRTEFREALDSEFDGEITQDIVDDFIDYCQIDITEWLNDNIRHYEPPKPLILHGKTPDDYLYCETCKTFVDFWKYDHSRDAAGHLNCNVRSITEEEFRQLIKECEEAGCFEENSLSCQS